MAPPTRKPSKRTKFDKLIKPSDNWNFSPVRYTRIEANKSHGYIPGDIYANCFWYYVKPNNLVVDPMAGSGMAKTVYDDRTNWMGEHSYDFNLRLFDLTPQQPYIQQNNLLDGFPVANPDYIFMDIPYYGMTNHAYSKHPDDLANMPWEQYLAALKKIAAHCAAAQRTGALCTVISPNYSDVKTGKVLLVPMHIVELWFSAGYALHHKVYASRRIQQTQSTRMALLNNLAKANRTPLTDISEILTFRKAAAILP